MLAFEQRYGSKKDILVQVIAEEGHQARSPKDQPNVILKDFHGSNVENVAVLTTSTQA
jgi:hypothetical protein